MTLQNEGIIYFKTSVTEERLVDFPKQRQELFKRILSQKKYTLSFNKNESLWQNKEQEIGDGFDPEKINIYRKLTSQIFFEIKDVPAIKTFLVVEGRVDFNWELTGNTEIIAGYKCLEANLNIDKEKDIVKAYYTPDISVSIGPIKYCGLDGAILKIVNISNGSTYEAEKIEFKKLPFEITKPKGKAISNKEYTLILEKIVALGPDKLKFDEEKLKQFISLHFKF